MKRIGILGGTFDPPHQGHLIMAEFTRSEMELDEVWFLPSHIPPHKQKAAVSAEDRLAMVEKAVEDNPHFKICNAELTRKGTSYTVDTMKYLMGQFKEHTFFFIIGGDMVEHLPKWDRIDELNAMVEFVGIKRPGYDWHPPLPVHQVEIPLIDISSSRIRNRLSSSKSVRYLVPESVNLYIKEHQLYAADSK
ncbi:nicotinate-nicotinamide nucleotide adenylyltransferase [Halobacillus halophilus]|uniref:Probable nicotinate-nucleotide adenylyltransferase n=1 Tax=Halobacillus halophilus (strain ATCC 35676 / DSM 2266 / JCM 20832 / KCTC 3685 / LMG 17431 / NBRC 102448 / NCIMB 2269) TaxID=866895 RepID=I0JP67_HALH3|nr:nicotinate-nucleotide adenylyltransferase [Halobacillus halophilus]ASF39974.1 nicotinate-nicotinamide nucleotide adenylyltransferase [Halobacillus halophilus]CCG45937.1 nicotinic acid mononucleotide adenyltransferase [Halobacillus halophilus DSM 2266]